ncbi:hypothetical protein HMPREF0742_00415 [Rothia aeria F0184]|uniref:Uncharacterized protein n=1 Tax=Rothia aeria F0184 TaxID=888019 RepID=U7V7H1_9MICC|nr:hypothetical protein HMPREF0742_00415 [Rothia aeria F0184]
MLGGEFFGDGWWGCSGGVWWGFDGHWGLSGWVWFLGVIVPCGVMVFWFRGG